MLLYELYQIYQMIRNRFAIIGQFNDITCNEIFISKASEYMLLGSGREIQKISMFRWPRFFYSTENMEGF